MELEIGGEVIRCTDTHPFQVKDKGWVKAENLQPGDLVYDKDWNTTPVERIGIILLPEPVEVYNFEVEDCHTYYVGNGCWLVHNGGCRSEAVRKAWKLEADNVRNGGNGITRTWTDAQKTELLNTGKVKGFVGHHMKSVKGYASLAGDPNNIQFLTRFEHLQAHLGNWRNITHGFFNCGQL